ncbi:MAG: site-specific integrase [Thermoproteota archaeon]
MMDIGEFQKDPKVAYWLGRYLEPTRSEYLGKLYAYFRWLWEKKRVKATPSEFFQEHVLNVWKSDPADLDTKRRHRLLLEEYVGLKGPLRDRQNAYRRHVAKVVASFYRVNECPLPGQIAIVNRPDRGTRKVHQIGLRQAAKFIRILPPDKQAAYLCALYSGMRPNELFSLKVGDLKWQPRPAPVIRVNLVNKKGDRASDYIHPYHTYIGGLAMQRLTQLLRARKAKPSEPLFRFSVDSLQRTASIYAQTHGFAQNKARDVGWRQPFHIYAMRKLFATLATEAAGMPERYVEYFLGHKGGVKEIYNRKEELYPQKFLKHYLRLQAILDEALTPILETKVEAESEAEAR